MKTGERLPLIKRRFTAQIDLYSICVLGVQLAVTQVPAGPELWEYPVNLASTNSLNPSAFVSFQHLVPPVQLHTLTPEHFPFPGYSIKE